MEIIRRPSARFEDVETYINDGASAATDLFCLNMFEPLWEAAERYGIDPVGMVAQSAHETGWGKFEGKVKPAFRNPAGLKLLDDQRKLFPGITDLDNPLSHAMFPSWKLGCIAMAQHLRRYAGVPVIDDWIVDYRYNLISPTSACVHFSDLGGRWAPRTDYGQAVERVAGEILRGIEGVKV